MCLFASAEIWVLLRTTNLRESQQHAVFEVVPRSDVVKAGELAPVFRIKLICAEGWSIGKTA